MNWESETAMDFFRETLEKEKVGGKVSFWDLYQEFNCQADELRKQRIKHNQAFALREAKKREILEQAEKEGVLVMK